MVSSPLRFRHSASCGVKESCREVYGILVPQVQASRKHTLFTVYNGAREHKAFPTTIVLSGGGHANLYALRRAAELAWRGFDMVLVDPSEHLHYSGMTTGVLSGSYEPGENRIGIR